MIITIDGPAGSGKSTISRMLAEKLGVLYLDTGAMYRAVALLAARMEIDPADHQGLRALCERLDLYFQKHGDDYRLYNGTEDISLAIRSPEMDLLSSRISAVPEVRSAMTGLQRKIGQKGNLVAEGRDMGTVVFPDAEFKFFITASPEIRAARRYQERIARGESADPQVVAAELKVRDQQDSRRALAPLRRADDAKLIDTTELSQNGVLKIVLKIIQPALV